MIKFFLDIVTAKGDVNAESNPNGALENIAGITNKAKNVFGMMPHPERAADSKLSNVDGKAIFESWLGLVNCLNLYLFK